MQTFIPGTTLPYEGDEGMFSKIRPLIRATDGLTLSQVCAITGLEGSSIQNWVKRGFVSRPEQKKYRERQLARILLISSLRDCMPLDRIGALMGMVNGDANDTDDDIISEEQMYDYLCAVIGRTENLPPDGIGQIVAEITSDYTPLRENAASVLRQALTVMALAYIAGGYKREADSLFDSMKENL
ncbi:DUF1836 domain-containing protein [Lachnoclostridium sp. MSJ-17]|nr:DUF1836 domain-containing protein [Lachnoclostridium sp. MSJ-17]